MDNDSVSIASIGSSCSDNNSSSNGMDVDEHNDNINSRTRQQQQQQQEHERRQFQHHNNNSTSSNTNSFHGNDDHSNQCDDHDMENPYGYGEGSTYGNQHDSESQLPTMTPSSFYGNQQQQQQQGQRIGSNNRNVTTSTSTTILTSRFPRTGTQSTDHSPRSSGSSMLLGGVGGGIRGASFAVSTAALLDTAAATMDSMSQLQLHGTTTTTNTTTSTSTVLNNSSSFHSTSGTNQFSDDNVEEDLGYEPCVPQERRGSMTLDDERQRRASIKAVMADTNLSPLSKRKSIQNLMDGRRRSMTNALPSAFNTGGAGGFGPAGTSSNPFGPSGLPPRSGRRNSLSGFIPSNNTSTLGQPFTSITLSSNMNTNTNYGTATTTFGDSGGVTYTTNNTGITSGTVSRAFGRRFSTSGVPPSFSSTATTSTNSSNQFGYLGNTNDITSRTPFVSGGFSLGHDNNNLVTAGTNSTTTNESYHSISGTTLNSSIHSYGFGGSFHGGHHTGTSSNNYNSTTVNRNSSHHDSFSSDNNPYEYNTPFAICSSPGTNNSNEYNEIIPTATSGSTGTNTSVSARHHFIQQQQHVHQINQQQPYFAISNDYTRETELNRPPCTHYARNCTIISACCGAAFGCRLCHDESTNLPPKINNGGERYHRSASLPSSFVSMEQEDTYHTIDRFAIAEIICRQCYTRQSSKTNNCIQCNVKFGEYHCSICNLWMSNEERPYHCEHCGFCRVGGAENFEHCHRCGMCIDIQLLETHNCKAGKYRSNCPVCQEYLFSSRGASHEMPCGHPIHWECFRQLAAHDSRCPICKKTAVTRERMMPTWSAMAASIAMQPIPPELCRVVSITCNDCEGAEDARAWHFLGMQCTKCQSFNTVVDKIHLSGTEAHEFLETNARIAEAYQQRMQASAAASTDPDSQQATGEPQRRRRVNRRRSAF